MRKRLLLFGTLSAVIALSALIVFSPMWPDGLAEIELSSPEATPILSALTKAFDVRAIVACQPDSDLNLLDSAFKDTPDYQPSSEQRAKIARVLGPQVADRAGYLSLLKAYYQELRQPVASVVATQVGVPLPTARPILYCPDPAPKVELKVESLRLDDQRAVVRYDDGAALQEAIVARIDGRWFVVSIENVALHF